METHTIDRLVDANGNEFVFSDSSKAEAGTASPLMDGKASVGNSLKYAREDHVHPSDTSREDIANKTTVVLGTSDSKYPTDKAVAEFVNSSIATNTANYISNNGEPFTSVEQLEAYSGPVTNNDYAFVTGIDSEGNTYYDRYKATVSGSTVTWSLEYRLNNSSFTAAQWSAINSGITSVLVAKIHEHSNKDVLDGITSGKVNSWDGKEDAFDVLPTTKGGTGTNAASKSALTSSLINSLSLETSTPVDADYYVAQYRNGGTSNTSFVRRPVSALWEYIKGKISSVLKLTASDYAGKAATAGTADKAVADNSGNDIETTYATKSELDAKANLTNSVAIFDGYVRRLNESSGWRRVAYKQFNGTSTNINALFRLYLIGSNADHIGLGDLFVNIRFNSSGSAPEFIACNLMSYIPLHTSIKLKVVGVAGNAVVEVWFRPPTFSMLMLSCIGNGHDVFAKTKDWTFEEYLNATDPEPVEDTANHVYVFSGTVRRVQLNIDSPTNNNLVSMDANGIVKDSGLAKSSVESTIRKAGSAIQGVKLNGASSELTHDSNNVVTIPDAVATGTTGATNGLMTSDDKKKLNGIASGTASPLMDGKASVGNSLKYAREDHVHPSDTSREDIENKTTVVLGTSDSKYPTDKAVAEFVNSSISTNTANYISNNGEPFTSVEQLKAYSGPVTNNDYASVTGIDSEGNTYYDRYKATVSGSTVTWALEYRLNNSSFTAAQWSAINSGITSVLVAKIHEHSNKDVLDGITSGKVNSWDGKEDAFDVLPTTKGGTGTNAASKSALTSSLINSLSLETSTPVDADYYVSQYADGGNTTTSYHRRPVSALWDYIKGKISSVLGLTATNYSGKAATAGKAIADASGNNIEETYQEKLGASVDASGVVSFPSDVRANGNETLATIRYLQAYYSQFPKAGQGITINTDSDGAPIILVKQWKEKGAQLTCQRANPGDLASWRMKNMNFDNMGRMSMISDDYTYMPVPNDFGTAGQLLVSNGNGNAPKWKSGIVLPPIQKGFAYSGSGNSQKYAHLFHICKSSQSGASDTIHYTFKIYTNTTGSGLSATADVWYRRNNDKQGTTKGQLTWTHGISPSEFKLYANVYDDLSNNININLYAYMGATYQRVEASIENISLLNSPSTITNTDTSLLTDFFSNSFAASLPTIGTNLELK